MAFKIYCDGCDEDISVVYQRNKVTISFGNEDGTNEVLDLDLCRNCANKLNPKRWPRYGKEAPRA